MITEDTYLNVIEGHVDNCKIVWTQFHSFLLFFPDEIRISIQYMDSYTQPCKSYVYEEGKVNALKGRGKRRGLVHLHKEWIGIYIFRNEVPDAMDIQKLKPSGILNFYSVFMKTVLIFCNKTLALSYSSYFSLLQQKIIKLNYSYLCYDFTRVLLYYYICNW